MASNACAPTHWSFNRQNSIDRLFISPTFTHSLVIYSAGFFFMLVVLFKASLTKCVGIKRPHVIVDNKLICFVVTHSRFLFSETRSTMSEYIFICFYTKPFPRNNFNKLRPQGLDEWITCGFNVLLFPEISWWLMCEWEKWPGNQLKHSIFFVTSTHPYIPSVPFKRMQHCIYSAAPFPRCY